MPIHGTIEEAGLPDVLQLLALGGKTGCLSVSDGDALGEIYLEAGRVSYAEVFSRRDHFAEKLVKRGRITRAQLDQAIAERSREGSPALGHILVDSGHVDRAEVERLLKLQAEEAVYVLFEWKQGQFTFSSNHRPPYHSYAISLDPENLLLEGARRVDEWDLIQRKIPSFDLVYRRSGSSLGIAAADLTDQQKRVLPLLDGTRDVNGIIEMSGLGEFDAVKAIYGLLMAGFAQLLERRSRVRHLEYREILAYVVKEAEFVDPARRKDAARHIADCLTCAKRLRNIHVRSTEGKGIPAVTASSLAVEMQSATADPELAAVLAPSVSVEPAAILKLHVQDRRAGVDRRQLERRGAQERRITVNASWSQTNAERRADSRRVVERRGTQGRNRRSGDAYGARPHGNRPTETRQIQHERRGQGRPQFASPAAPPSPPPPVREERPAAQATPIAEPPAAQTPPPAPPDVTAETQTRKAARDYPVYPRKLRESRSFPQPPASDIVWITTPEESLELVRKRRSEIREREAVARASGATLAPAEQPQLRRSASVAARRSRLRAWSGAIAATVAATALIGYGAMRLVQRGAAPDVSAARTAAPATENAGAPQPNPAAHRTLEPRSVVGVSDLSATQTSRASGVEPPAAPPAARTAAAPRVAALTSHVPAPVPVGPPAPARVSPPPVVATIATEADNELAAGGWTAIDRSEAKSILGGTLAAIPGLQIESITTSSVGGRPRVRVAQIARTGQRVVLTQMSAGMTLEGSGSSGPARASAVAVTAPSDANGMTIGTATVGNLFVTAKSRMAVDGLRPLLQRLAEVQP